MRSCFDCETLGVSKKCPTCRGTGETDAQQSAYKRCLKCTRPTRSRVVESREVFCVGCEPDGCGETKHIW